jgi:hypothetical protein
LFHECPAKYRLQVGGFGSGKSRPLLWEGVFHALEYPGSESIILRTTMPDLKRTVISKFKADVPASLYDYYHETDHIVYFKPVMVPVRDEHGIPALGPDGKQLTKLVTSKLYFGACENEDDTTKFLSTEWVFVGFEELGEFPFAVWNAFAGRNRCPVWGSRSCMAAASNPTGVGWGWMKKLWVDHVPFVGMDPTKYNARDYVYIHSTVDDNPIYSKDREYVRVLEADPRRDVVRWGKLDLVPGQYFDNWNVQRHFRRASDFTFQDWQETWIGWDYGFGHYACITFHTKAMFYDKLRRQHRMVNVTTREIVMHEATPKEQTEALIASIPRDKDGNFKEKIAAVYLSWERFNRTVGQFTVADEIGDLLSSAGLVRPSRASTDRVAGWQKMYSLLDTDDWFVLDTCPTVAESIPELVRHKERMEDVIKPKGAVLSDDVGDSVRYGIAGHLLDAEDEPDEVKLKRRLDKIEDPFRKHVEQYRAWIEKKKEQENPSKIIIMPTWQSRLKQ